MARFSRRKKPRRHAADAPPPRLVLTPIAPLEDAPPVDEPIVDEPIVDEPVVHESAVESPVLDAPIEDSPPDPLRRDADYLVAIARRHAAIALASPAETRAARLEACRLVWINYAAAFAVSSAMQKRFADDMQAITRALIAEQQDSGAALPAAGNAVLTIDELRPLLRQIIGQ
jgi:hypothetical protein